MYTISPSLLRSGWGRLFRCVRLKLLLLGLHYRLSLTKPALYSDLTVDGVGFSKPVVDRRSQSMKGNLSFAIPFCSGDFSASQSSGTTDLDAQGAEVAGRLNRFLHCPAERDTAFDL